MRHFKTQIVLRIWSEDFPSWVTDTLEKDGDILRSTLAYVIFGDPSKGDEVGEGTVGNANIAKYRKKWAVAGIAEFELSISDQEMAKAPQREIWLSYFKIKNLILGILKAS